MGPDRIVDGFLHPQVLIKLAHGPLQVRHLVELFLVSPLRAFDMPVQLRRARGQDEEANPPTLERAGRHLLQGVRHLTGCFELP